MRLLLFITVILVLVACTSKSSVGKPLAKEFKYSAFLWHLSPDNDSFNFYLAHYIDVDHDGHFKLMRRDSFMSTPHFFEGTLSDTIRRLIDATFVKDTFETDYNSNVDDDFVYDGLKYRMDIENSDGANPKKIYFIPNKAPSGIYKLATKLDTLVYNIKDKAVDSFNTHMHQQELKNDYVTKYGQLPKVFREQPKFQTEIQ